jgi:dihydrofolate reductase
MKFFKEKTIGNVVVMGLATLKSFPGGKPLKDRVNVVLCDDPSFARDDIVKVDSIEHLFEVLKRYKTDIVYIIGGASVYAQLVPYCDTVYVTKVDASQEADKFFPNLDEDEDWACVKEGEIQEYNGIKYKFTTYKNI